MKDSVSLINGHIDDMHECAICKCITNDTDVLCKKCANDAEAFINSIEMALDYNIPITDKELKHYRELLNILYEIKR